MNPYSGLPASRFWRSGVKGQNWSSVEDLYVKKFDIAKTAGIMTAGSCFAQHIGRRLKKNAYRVIDMEPAPLPLRGDAGLKFGYGMYSARYGNIYTARQLLQLLEEALGRRDPGDIVWRKNDRFVDALRPNVEPHGLDSPEEVMAHREQHLRAVINAVRRTDLFIFTFGLTEAWIDNRTQTVLPIVPGTSAGGEFDPAIHMFRNFTYDEVMADFSKAKAIINRIRPDAKFLVTVSPVPLAATASPEHVLSATSYSKSVLRAVAGALYHGHDDVDYFPSYEIITSPFAREFFYDHETLRDVRPDSVEMVMNYFFRQHPTADAPVEREQPVARAASDDVVCEESLLAEFAQR